MSLKKLIPVSVKTNIRLVQRLFNDRLSGMSASFAKADKQAIEFNHFIQLKQEIKLTPLFENKLSNIQLSCDRVNQVVIKPGQVFSFWETVGAPNLRNGFKVGRNIISGKLSEAIGGGLCQASSILYHLSLVSGLSIVERYNHTIDIYTEETRFTPLGADATVVYGHKDLRVRNDYGFPVKFFLEITGNQLTANLFSQSLIAENLLVFNKKESDSFVEITTVNQDSAVLGMSIYRKPQQEAA